MTERWRKVVDWPHYEISDLGRCRSLDRIVAGKLDGDGVPSRRRLSGQLLAPVVRPSGLICYNLWHGNVYRQLPARRLVLEAFDGTRPRGQDAVNENGDLSNNSLTNLTWGYSDKAPELRAALRIVR